MPTSWKALVTFLPSAICWPAMRSASRTTRLPAVSSELRTASRMVMPEEYIMAKVLAKRDRMILRSTGPRPGMASLTRSIM